MLRRLLTHLVQDKPGLTLFVSLVVVGLLSVGLVGLSTDLSIDDLIATDDPDREFLDASRGRFGSDEIVVITLVTEDVFTSATLGKVKAMTHALEDVKGVAEVISLSSANHIEGTSDGVRVGPLSLRLPPPLSRSSVAPSLVPASS